VTTDDHQQRIELDAGEQPHVIEALARYFERRAQDVLRGLEIAAYYGAGRLVAGARQVVECLLPRFGAQISRALQPESGCAGSWRGAPTRGANGSWLPRR
jgi:hypothetical protein